MPDLSAVDLNLLVALDLLLDEQSVRGAARRAHVSPSAMSHTLSRLRDLFEDDLLVRAGRQMVPTPRAESLVEPLKSLLAQARGVLSDAAHFDPSRLRRRFRVTCTDHVSTVLLPKVESMLRAEAPDVDLGVVPLVPETMADLRRGRIDAAIGVFPDAPPEMRMRRLFGDHFVTVCRPQHPRLRDAEQLPLEGFLAESHILVAPRGDSEGIVDTVLAGLGHTRRVARVFPGFLAGMWHVAESDALLTISARLVRATRDRLPVRCFRTPVPVDPYALMLAWHPRVDSAPSDVWFRQVLVRAAEALPPVRD